MGGTQIPFPDPDENWRSDERGRPTQYWNVEAGVAEAEDAGHGGQLAQVNQVAG